MLRTQTAMLLLLFGLHTSCGNDEKDDTSSSIEVTSDCVAYLECMAIADPDNLGLYEATYGEGGECWSGGSSEALTCTEACQVGLETALVANPGEAACWPDGNPDMLYVFMTQGTWDWETSGSCDLPYEQVTTRFSAEASGQVFQMEMSFFIMEYEYELETTCTETGWDFTCEPMTQYGDTWTSSGTFADSFTTGTQELRYTYEGTEYSCTLLGEER